MVEREWREASDMRRSTLTLVAVLAVAAILRFWALGAGIPNTLGVDEPQIMQRSVRMMKAGTLNPEGFFDYPGLYLYVQAAVATARFLTGAMAGEWRSLNDVGSDDFYLWGRAVTATLGTLTVLVVYRIGMRWGARHALLSAALLAVMPLHVRESHYVLTDIPTTFLVMVAFLLTLAAHEHPTAAAFAKAGGAAGLAAATKYPGSLVLILPLVAIWMTPDSRPSRVLAALATVAAAAVTFLIAAPYTILDLPGFLNSYAALAYGYANGEPPEPGWLLYLKHLRTSFLWPAMLLLAAGVVLATWTRRPRTRSRSLDAGDPFPADLRVLALEPVVGLRPLSAAGYSVPMPPHRRRRRVGREPASALRHSSTSADGHHRRPHGGGAAAASDSGDRLQPADQPAQHPRRGVYVDRGQPSPRLDRGRGDGADPPAAEIQVEQHASTARPRLCCAS